MKRNAFMDTYKKEEMFKDSNEEFDDSRETVRQLIEEYGEAEKGGYLEWGSNNMQEHWLGCFYYHHTH